MRVEGESYGGLGSSTEEQQKYVEANAHYSSDRNRKLAVLYRAICLGRYGIPYRPKLCAERL